MGWQQNETPSTNIPFMWIAQYHDNSYIMEFDEEKKETSFNQIEKENVKNFYLIGRKQKFGFKTEDGVFDIFNDKFEFYLEDKNHKLIKLTNRSAETYNDIIQYKGGYADYAPGSGQKNLTMTTTSYHIGWKKMLETEFGKLNFKIIFEIHLNQKMNIEFKVTPQFDFEGTLFIRRNGEILRSFEINANKGTSSSQELVLMKL